MEQNYLQNNNREIGTETHNAITIGEPKNIKGKPTSNESKAKIGIK
jgi:hypothetical protein